MKYLIIPISLVLLLSCDKEKASAYPDCFSDLTATHTVDASFAASVYITLNDSSVMFFGLSDEQLNIKTNCKTLSPADLVEYNAVHYIEWSPHPDSVAPDFFSDVMYVNTSTTRRWDLTSGSITAAVSKPADQREMDETYEMSIKLTDAVFDRSAAGLPDVTFSEIVLTDVLMGGFGPG